MRSRLALVGALVFLAAGSLLAASEKRLIEFGWDEPDTAFMRAQIAQIEAMPFDGCVFTVRYVRADTMAGRFSWEVWGKVAFVARDLKQAKADLAATKFGRFTDNFLRVNVTPSTVDWFGDFGPTLNNMRVAARLSRHPSVKGICFDMEPYSRKIWDYAGQANAATKTWAEYNAQVKKRGGEVMRAIQKGRPTIALFLPFAYSDVWEASNHGVIPPEKTGRSFMRAFLDGMVAAAKPGVTWIEGHEEAYGWKNPKTFTTAYNDARVVVPYVSADTPKYRAMLSVGFGLWLDFKSDGGVPWKIADPSANYFSPPVFEATVRTSLTVADRYAWIYTQKPLWWTAAGVPERLPPAYVDAVWKAREGLCPPRPAALQRKAR